MVMMMKTPTSAVAVAVAEVDDAPPPKLLPDFADLIRAALEASEVVFVRLGLLLHMVKSTMRQAVVAAECGGNADSFDTNSLCSFPVVVVGGGGEDVALQLLCLCDLVD